MVRGHTRGFRCSIDCAGQWKHDIMVATGAVAPKKDGLEVVLRVHDICCIGYRVPCHRGFECLICAR